MEAFADPFDLFRGFARVGIAGEDDDDHRRFEPARSVGTGIARRTEARPRIPAVTFAASPAGTTAVSGEPSPGGKCSFRTSVPSLELVGSRLALAEADRAVVAEVARREDEEADDDERR